MTLPSGRDWETPGSTCSSRCPRRSSSASPSRCSCARRHPPTSVSGALLPARRYVLGGRLPALQIPVRRPGAHQLHAGQRPPRLRGDLVAVESLDRHDRDLCAGGGGCGRDRLVDDDDFPRGTPGCPRELEEAALVDGANWWQRFKAVTVPAIWPATVFVIVHAGDWWAQRLLGAVSTTGGRTARLRCC